jgi:hypothetical protein
LDPKERFEKELSQFINEKKFERVKKETEEYKYPPILHVQNKLHSNILE